MRLDGDWQPYPAPLPGVEVQPQPDLLTAFERAAAPGGSPEEAVVPVSWLEAAEKHLGRALKRVRSLQSELDEAEDPDALSAVGDLLLSRLAEIPKGEARVGLEGFDGSRVDVAIDPSLHPHENADRYYSRAARARRARQRLPALIAEAEAAAGRAQRFLTRIRSGDVERSDLEQEFPELRALSPGTGVPLPYRVFHSSGGLEIRVGRGAKANDELTFHHSRPDDVWLHARHASGAHVILRWAKEESPPGRDLEEAAVLAARNSRARTSTYVPVDWTRRKYVRKPRKSAPGIVVVGRARTLFVSPDDDEGG